MNTATFQMKASYDELNDTITLSSTSEEDFPQPLNIKLNPGTKTDSAVRAFLADQGLIPTEEDEEEETASGVFYPPAFSNGQFGVYADTHLPAPYSLKRDRRVTLTGNESSGKINFTRLLLNYAAQKDIPVLTINTGDEVFGMADQLSLVIHNGTIGLKNVDQSNWHDVQTKVIEITSRQDSEMLVLIDDRNGTGIPWSDLFVNLGKNVYTVIVAGTLDKVQDWGAFLEPVVVFRDYKNQTHLSSDFNNIYTQDEVLAPTKPGEAIFFPAVATRLDVFWRPVPLLTYLLPKK